jgi:hypothetical protein
MMHATMLVQAMMQATNDGGVHDISRSSKKVINITTKYMHEQFKRFPTVTL